MPGLRRAGYGVRLRYVKLVVVLVATQACPATACVSCQRDVRYVSRTSSNAGVSRHGVRLLSEGRTLTKLRGLCTPLKLPRMDHIC